MTTTDCNDQKLVDFCNSLCACYDSLDIDPIEPETGIVFSIISDNLYFQSGDRINKLKSLAGFTKLICWLLKSGAEFSTADANIPGLTPGCNSTVVDFCKGLCKCFTEFDQKFIVQKGFDPEDKVIFDPEDKVIFDPEDKVIFDAIDSFYPDDGVPFNVSDIEEPIFDSYGNMINKSESLDGFKKLVCWLLKSEKFNLPPASDFQT